MYLLLENKNNFSNKCGYEHNLGYNGSYFFPPYSEEELGAKIGK